MAFFRFETRRGSIYFCNGWIFQSSNIFYPFSWNNYNFIVKIPTFIAPNREFNLSPLSFCNEICVVRASNDFCANYEKKCKQKITHASTVLRELSTRKISFAITIKTFCAFSAVIVKILASNAERERKLINELILRNCELESFKLRD